ATPQVEPGDQGVDAPLSRWLGAGAHPARGLLARRLPDTRRHAAHAHAVGNPTSPGPLGRRRGVPARALGSRLPDETAGLGVLPVWRGPAHVPRQIIE